MFFLYVLECMLRIPLEIDSSTSPILITTGEIMTSKDVSVGCIGWVILEVLVFGIILFIKYWKNRHQLKSKWKKQKMAEKKERLFTKKEVRDIYIFLGVSLLILIIGSALFLITFIGRLMMSVGIIMIIQAILIPLFKYAWRKFKV